MIKNKISKYFLFISIFTFISIFVYIVQQSYSKLMSPINQAKSSYLINPINPNLDISTLDIIEKRLKHNSDSYGLLVPTPLP